MDADVFVLGGGPAGLASALAARREGLRVILADSRKPPIDKVCGEGLMPDSLAAAKRLGIELPFDEGRPFRGIRFCGPNNKVAADFPDGSGLGLRRPILHRALVDHAERAGVELLWNCPVLGIDGQKMRMVQRTITARWIVGADGAQSSIRRWAALDRLRRESFRFSFRRHYRMEPWSSLMEVHWGLGCQFYITPVSATEVCVVLMSRDQNFRIDQALPRFPELSTRLKTAEAAPERGSLAATRRFHRITKGNIALAGDASGTVDPITGDGMGLAFQQASALGKAFRVGDLSIYESANRRMARKPRFMGDFMLMLDRWPGLQTRALASLEARPDLFSNLLAMHVGRIDPGRLAATMAMLGWKVASV